jgi:hypothetical protein
MAKNHVPAGGELSDAIAKALNEVRNAAEMVSGWLFIG